MENKDRLTLAALLRNAASQTISEALFWAEMQELTDRVDEPIVKLAVSSATGFWQLFHTKKRFLLRPSRPDAEALRQVTDELNLIAAVLETGWQLPVLPELNEPLSTS